MNLTEGQIDAAAKWWKERLRKPKFQLLTEEGRANPEEKGAVLAEKLLEMGKENFSEEQLDRFEEELKAGLQEAKSTTFIGVDYHPDKILNDAAERAGIKCGMSTFSPKTRMYFEDGKVEASCGYGEQAKEIFRP